MSFRILGPLAAEVNGVAVTLHGPRQHTVLATLLLERERPVSVGRLAEALWDDKPPATARAQVQIGVSALRRVFAGAGLDADTIVTGPAGYLMRIAPDDLDAAVFERRVAEARKAASSGARALAVDRFRQALALWRGDALAGIPSKVVQAGAIRWNQFRLAVLEECLDLELRLGRHAPLVAELAGLVAQHPSRERFRAQFMLALYRAGRQAEALEAYRAARQFLIDEFGIEPGPELRALNEQILRSDPDLDQTLHLATRVSRVPQQLPPDTAGFTGRHRQLEQLRALLHGKDGTDGTDSAGGTDGTDDTATTALTIAVIAGTPGVGKTALAVRWAHQAGDLFPDGRLYVNLRGFSSSAPVRPAAALAQLLRALDVPAEQIPVELEQAAGLYRTVLTGRRLLVVLDNAASPDQVRPLLPGSPGCVVVVTSRDQLAGLVAREGANLLTLDILPPDEAVALLARNVGDERIRAEPEATVELAKACGYLPLALRVAAADLRIHPRRSVAEHVSRLYEGDRLTALEVPGDPQSAVRASFDLSYATLAAEARRLFRLLGLVPGPDFTPDAVAALAGVAPHRAGRLLDQLAAAHMVSEHVPGRYALHDLLHLYAQERAADDDTEHDRGHAVSRLYDWYLRAVEGAARLFYPEMLRLPVPAPAADSAPPVSFDHHAEAMAWLEAERPNLVAAVVHAAEHGPRETAWLLADTLRGYFFSRRHTGDWLTAANAGLAAARREGDAQAEAAAHQNLGLARYSLGEYQPAIEHFTRAHTRSQQTGWLDGEATSLGNLGIVHSELGQPELAAANYTRALAIYRRTSRRGSQATCLTNLGGAYRELGELERAVTHHEQALALYREIGSRSGEARALSSLGADHHQLGRLNESTSHFVAALSLCREVGDRDGEATSLDGYGSALCDLGDYDAALHHAQTALVLAGETGDRLTEAAALNTYGTVLRLQGSVQDAMERQDAAMRLAGEIGYRLGEVRALGGLAASHLLLGRLGEAAGYASRAVALAEGCGYRVLQGEALAILAEVYLARGDGDLGAANAERALVLHEASGHRLGEARTRLVLAHALERADPAAALDHRLRARTLLAEAGVADAAWTRT